MPDTWLEIPSMGLRLAVESWEWDREIVECDREIGDPVEYEPGAERYTIKLHKGAGLGRLAANRLASWTCPATLKYDGVTAEITGRVRAIADDCITINVARDVK